jgi:hypothetical protein
MEDHPALELRNSLSLPYIAPTLPGDRSLIRRTRPRRFIYNRKFTPDDEVKSHYRVTQTLAARAFGSDRSNPCAAQRTRRKSSRGSQSRRMEPVELLQSSQSTARQLKSCRACWRPQRPGSQRQNGLGLPGYSPRTKIRQEGDAFVKKVAGLLRQCKTIEAFLWPRSGDPWLDVARRWQRGRFHSGVGRTAFDMRRCIGHFAAY